MCVCICVYVHVSAVASGGQKRASESRGAGVAGGCEPFPVGARTLVLWESMVHPYQPSHSSSPQSYFLVGKSIPDLYTLCVTEGKAHRLEKLQDDVIG